VAAVAVALLALVKMLTLVAATLVAMEALACYGAAYIIQVVEEALLGQLQFHLVALAEVLAAT
jgi:hypothetical protein